MRVQLECRLHLKTEHCTKWYLSVLYTTGLGRATCQSQTKHVIILRGLVWRCALWLLPFIPPSFITSALSRQRTGKQIRQKLSAVLRFGVCVGEIMTSLPVSPLSNDMLLGVPAVLTLKDLPWETPDWQMQQSPPSPHPINHYCCGIIVKQAGSLLSAQTHRRDEDGRPEDLPKTLAVQLNQLHLTALPPYLCVVSTIWRTKVSKRVLPDQQCDFRPIIPSNSSQISRVCMRVER